MRNRKRGRTPAISKIVIVLLCVVFLGAAGLWLWLGGGIKTVSEFLNLDSGEKTAADYVADNGSLPWYLQLVNKTNPLEGDIEIELTVLGNDESVDQRIYPELQQMFDDAREAGIYPIVAAGYRSHEKQESLLQERIKAFEDEGNSASEAKKLALEWVALPGTSEHELGLAVDINADGINSAGYEVYEWLDENAYKYGFVKRFEESKADITGISNEDWHYRYVGTEVAAELRGTKECLEEYLMRKYPPKE